MTKREFITDLRDKLSGLPKNDVEERILFYSEMIDDKMEDGLSEEAAVGEMGNIDDIVEQTVSDIPLTRIVREKFRSKSGLKPWQTVLLIAGSVVWAPLLIALLAVIFSLWISLWAVVISLWAVDISFAVSAVGAFIMCFVFIASGNTLTGLFMLGAALVLAGLFIFLLFACKALTKGSAILTKKIVTGIKRLFIGKEDAK